MRAGVLVLLFLFMVTGLSACQTSRTVSFAYHDATFGGDSYKTSNKTSVLFLVDGLSTEMLKTALRAQVVPAIANAFSVGAKGRFALGRAVFPSLTFPNITSILTGRPVSEHLITGNRVFIDGQLVNFESVLAWHDLAISLQRKTIFYKLAATSESSVSYSYAFSGGATAFQETSPAAAANYLESDYAAIDTQTLSSLQRLLSETQPSRWPRFIFVHLIGVDATAHENGPQDKTVQAYLATLDSQLADIFRLLDHPDGTAAPTRDISYALTADHGFKSTPDHSPLDQVVLRMRRRIRLIADNRIAPLFIDEPGLSEKARHDLAQALLQVPHVGWAALKTPTGIDLLKRTGERAHIWTKKKECTNGETAASFEWIDEESGELTQPKDESFTCLSGFGLSKDSDDDSFIVPALVDYFQASTSPDMVFVPDDHSDFATGFKGNHGGLTRDEMLVPVLTHNADLEHGIHPTYQLLRALKVFEP